MPTNKSGKFFHNSQRASASDREPAAKPEGKPMGPTHGMDGQEPHMGHAMMEAAAQHPIGGKHMHIHQGDDGKLTSHHVGEDGEVQGPHEHENTEALGQHMKQFFDGEAQEGEMPPEHGGGMAMHHGGGLHGM